MSIEPLKQEVKLSDNELKVAGIVEELAPVAYKDVHSAYNDFEKKNNGKPVTVQYVANIVNTLADKGVVSTSQEGNKKLASIATGATLGENSAWIPSGLEPTPEQRLKTVLNLYNVKGDTQQKILGILALNPALDNNQSLFGVLTNLRIEPSNAKLITETYYGAQQYSAGMAAAAGRASFLQPQMMGMGGYPGYPQYQQPQTVFYQQTPQGLIPVIMAGPSVPAAASQPAPQPQQPIVIKTGEFRKVRRPITDKEGKVQKDPETKEPLYEEVEEPVVLTAGGSGGTEALLLKYILEGGGGMGGNNKVVQELQKQVNELEKKALLEKIEQVEAKTNENIQGLVASVNKNQQELVKAFTDKLEDMRKDAQHAEELAAARGTAGERPIVAITKEVSKAAREIVGEVRSTVQGMYPGYRPGSMPPPPGQPMSEQQMIEEARRIREAGARQQHA